jgi:hypothetical protein
MGVFGPVQGTLNLTEDGLGPWGCFKSRKWSRVDIGFASIKIVELSGSRSTCKFRHRGAAQAIVDGAILDKGPSSVPPGAVAAQVKCPGDGALRASVIVKKISLPR